MLNISKINLFAGDTWNWTETITGYSPANGDSLKLQLKHNSDAVLEINATADGNSFLINRPATETAALIAGTYVYNYQITSANITKSLEFGTIEILPNLSLSGDARSYWHKIVDQLKAAYSELTLKGMASVTINGKTIIYTDRAKLLLELHNAEIRAGLIKAASKKIQIRFNS